jgi:flagellin
MSSDIVLTAALRNNLLSLQTTQRLIDSTQLRLATGLKVNSALDNPSSFFTSQALNNRASDLTRLLDSINLSLRTIEEADKGVTALNALVEQANSIAESARDELAATTAGARVVGNVDLSLVATPTTLTGVTTGDAFTITTTDDSGTQIANSFVFSATESVQALLARVTDVYADTRNGEIIAYLNDDGGMVIESKDGRAFKLSDSLTNSQVGTAGWASLGLDRYFDVEQRSGAAGQTFAAANIVGGNTAYSMSLYESAGNLADAGDLLVGATYIDANGATVLTGFATAGSVISFTVNTGATSSSVSQTLTATTSWQDIVDLVNQNTTLNTSIQANFDGDTGQFSITSLSDTVDSVEVQARATANATFDIGLGDPTGAIYPLLANTTGTAEQVISFNSSTEVLDNLANDYNEIRSQIDTIVQDANFRGVNLLNGDDLTTFFNEDRTSSLVTEGQTFTSGGLGLNEATFRTESAIEGDLDRVIDALASIRAFGSTLANSLSIIQTRRDFTSETVNVLKSGAEDLTVADQNEEGANLLALQTRQALGVTSLSLASQSQQSVLRLF